MANKNVTCRITLYRKPVRQLTDAMAPALIDTANMLQDEIRRAKVVPRMDGPLGDEKFFVDESGARKGKVRLVHEGPYARRLYFHPEYHFHREPWAETIKRKDGRVSNVTHDGNVNAKGKWFSDWLPGGKKADFAQKAFNANYKRRTGI